MLIFIEIIIVLKLFKMNICVDNKKANNMYNRYLNNVINTLKRLFGK